MTVDRRVPYEYGGPAPAGMGRGSTWIVFRSSERSRGGSADRHLELVRQLSDDVNNQKITAPTSKAETNVP